MLWRHELEIFGEILGMWVGLRGIIGRLKWWEEIGVGPTNQ